jgi:N-acetylneuraminic acid mutarotase
VLAGNLLAIGGFETSKGGAAKKEVYVYSPSTNSWIYISDLSAPRSNTAVAGLSSTEFLVIGGWGDGSIVNTVYKGTLTLLQQCT